MRFKNKNDGLVFDVPDEAVTSSDGYWIIKHGDCSYTTLYRMDGWVNDALPEYDGYIVFSSDIGHVWLLGGWNSEEQAVFFVNEHFELEEVTADHITWWSYARIETAGSYDE